MAHEPTESRFLKDVTDHQMEIIRDDGIYRHLRFKRPGTNNMYFNLVTWPGYLAYSGDMGCFVFSRLADMFEFFRIGKNDWAAINLGYWSEKLQAVDGNRDNGSAREFDEEKFNRVVTEYLVGWIRENRYSATKDERRELWDAVMSNVIGADGDSDGHRKRIAAHDFSHFVNNDVGDFYFRDFWEYDLMKFSYRFVWCCYALAWGIRMYDEVKGGA